MKFQNVTYNTYNMFKYFGEPSYTLFVFRWYETALPTWICYLPWYSIHRNEILAAVRSTELVLIESAYRNVNLYYNDEKLQPHSQENR